MTRGFAADVGLFQDRADPPERGGELAWIIGADDAPELARRVRKRCLFPVASTDSGAL